MSLRDNLNLEKIRKVFKWSTARQAFSNRKRNDYINS